jgi:hypothetical protein
MATTRIDKTFASAGTRNKWTFSAWIKTMRNSGTNHIFSYYNADNARWSTLQIEGSDRLRYYDYNGGTFYTQLVSTRKLRDANAWYHIVLRYDTPQSTAADRVRMYVNGEQLTVFDTATYPNQNHSAYINNDTNPHTIGHEITGGYFDGVMSHIHFTDGYSYGADSFGSTDSTTGEWKINTSPSVTYGTNGFWILKDGNSLTDQSPNTNNWSANGGTLTKTEDSPSNIFATLNPLSNYWSNQTFSYGNNKIVSPGDRHDFAISTLGMNVGSGKYYAEFKLISAAGSAHCVVGISDHSYMGNNEELGQENYSIAYVNGGTLRSSNTDVATGVGTYTAGDIIGVAVDMENLKIYWHKNGTYVNSGVPTSGSTGTGAVSIHNIDTSPNSSARGQGNYFFAVGNWHSGASSTWEANFGNGYFGTTAVSSAGTNASNNGIFEYDVPSGFTALSTKGLNL